jgi:hypothetical protein
MPKVKVSEATGVVLDWLVNQCEGGRWEAAESFRNYHEDEAEQGRFHYSTNWAQGGPIIEREKLQVYASVTQWTSCDNFGNRQAFGPTPLIAAMRCYVASKLGDEVEVPQEIL